MEKLKEALNEILADAENALAALNLISELSPSVLVDSVYERSNGLKEIKFSYLHFIKSRVDGCWKRIRKHFASFYLCEGKVHKYVWGEEISNPGGLLAKLLAKEKEKFSSITKLTSVPDNGEE